MPNPSSSSGQLQRAGNTLAPQQKRLITSKKKRKFKASKIRESFSPSVAFMEKGQDSNSPAPSGQKQKNRVYAVTIIGEGLGNSKDKNWYSGEALVSGAKLFNGAKSYADHPDAIAEKTLPERSMKDLVGWYSDCVAQKGQDGKVVLRGKLHFFPAAKWLTDMIDTILTDPTASQGGQDGKPTPLFGISINAIGKTRPATMQGEQVNYVESFQRVDSADVVTEPAARGKFEKILESRSGARGRFGAGVNSVVRNKRMREAGQLSPKVVKKLADECTAAAMSDDPDEMKQALLDVQKELYPLSSISGKGPGQPNEEQYANVNPAGGSEMARPGQESRKVRASGGRRMVRRKRTFEAAGTGEDNRDLGEPNPSDIEQNLEEADVEDKEGDDLGEIDDFGDSSKQTKNREALVSRNRGRMTRRPVQRQQTQEDEGFEGEESLEDEGMEDGNSTSMGGGMGGGGGMSGGGGGAMPPPSSAGPGSSRMVTAKHGQDDDGGDQDGQDGGDSMGDGDDMGIDDDLGESFESEEGMEGLEGEEGMEGMEDESMEAEPVMQGRESGNRRRRRSTREAKDDVQSAGKTGVYGKSGSAAMPSHADAADDFEEDYTLGKRDRSTSGTGKSYKIKTSVGQRNRPVHPKVVRKLVHEANRRIEILAGRVSRLREAVSHKENVITRYQGIIRYHNSKVTGRRLLESAVEREWLPEGYANTLAPKLYGMSKEKQIREIKIHARLLEATREAVDDGRGTRLMESVEGMGARGGAVSRTGSSDGVDSELIESMSGDGIPFAESE